MTIVRLPPALRSRLQLQKSMLPESVPTTAVLPLTPLGTTYTMAQEAAWLDDEHFAIGRWDGSLGIYAFERSETRGPVINCAVNCPALEGVQMITALGTSSFASSNDEETIAVWSSTSSKRWTDTRVQTLLRYDRAFGVANSGVVVPAIDIRYFVAGHSNGFVTIWHERSAASDWAFVTSADLRAGQPVNPWGLHNIRGLDVVSAGQARLLVVAGSEDGDLTLLDVPSATVISKTCYNKAAQRGINALAVHATMLLVANCAVGAADRNLWAYEVDVASGRIALTDAVNLAIDSTAPQVFNFDVVWASSASPDRARVFFSSTEEGVLWVGKAIEGGKLSVLGNIAVTRTVGHGQLLNLGSAVCISRDRLSVANYDVKEFMLELG